MDIFDTDKRYIANTYSRFNVEIAKGKGAVCYDNNGKEYIDLASGIAVNTFGFCDDEWVYAIEQQLKLFQHTSNLYYGKPCVELAKLLCEKGDMKKVFFGNSGAEANECAIKVARKYAQDKYGEDYFNIITLNNSFHGRTITTLSATAQDVFHKKFLPLTDGFIYAQANDYEDVLQKVNDNKVCAIMFEVVQGEGGVLPLDYGFVQKVCNLAKEKDVLIICDEVQTGNGRTGEFFGYMNYGIRPDIVSTAKGLGGGLPIGACLFNEKTEKVLGYGDHGSTFGGNPLACAGALSIIKRLDRKMLDGVKEKSKLIFDSLSGAKGIKSVSGLGLMIGIETEKGPSAVIEKCLENGVMVIKAKNKVRLLPPLNIENDLLIKGLEVIKQALV